jgi:3-oxoacyl-[acyl-carrier protein] reductase
MDIQGKTVLITGAARGLGAAMAEHFAGLGARLALVDLDDSSLVDIRRRCTAQGAETEVFTGNVADEAQVAGFFDDAVQAFGRIDVAIANAGILRDGLLVKLKPGEAPQKLSLADWQAVIDVNLTGVFLSGREAAARMLADGMGGCIINISSISRHGNFGQSNYSAAKAGVAALTAVWAKELARHSIRVNAIAPGFVATDILKSMPADVLAKMTAAIPVGRLGQPAEIAATAAFLVQNDYMNGRVIDIDGGQRL